MSLGNLRSKMNTYQMLALSKKKSVDTIGVSSLKISIVMTLLLSLIVNKDISHQT